MTTDELRAKFEATFPHLDFSADKYGNYYSQRTLDHLYGYQAGQASRDAEVEALICKYEKRSMYGDGGVYSNIIDDLQELLGK